MTVKVVLSSDEIVRGLKHYRRIAKQDILRAPETEHPEHTKTHAEARREIYAKLASLAETESPADVALTALNTYKELPFVTGTPATDYVDIKAKENALENFFLMIGLEPKVRREFRSQRPSMQS